MILQVVIFTSTEDVMKHQHNEETLKLPLTFKSTTENQPGLYLKSDSDDLGQVVELGTDVVFYESKTIGA